MRHILLSSWTGQGHSGALGDDSHASWQCRNDDLNGALHELAMGQMHPLVTTVRWQIHMTAALFKFVPQNEMGCAVLKMPRACLL